MAEPWKNAQWRKTAKKFIGQGLAPEQETPYSDQAFQMAVEATKAHVTDPHKRMEQLMQNLASSLELQKADLEWHNWFQILRAYFPPFDARSENAYTVVSAIHALGWAGIVLLILTPLNHGFLWIISLVALVLGFLWSLFLWPDPWGYQLTARMLREFREEQQRKN